MLIISNVLICYLLSVLGNPISHNSQVKHIPGISDLYIFPTLGINLTTACELRGGICTNITVCTVIGSIKSFCNSTDLNHICCVLHKFHDIAIAPDSPTEHVFQGVLGYHGDFNDLYGGWWKKRK